MANLASRKSWNLGSVLLGTSFMVFFLMQRIIFTAHVWNKSNRFRINSRNGRNLNFSSISRAAFKPNPPITSNSDFPQIIKIELREKYYYILKEVKEVINELELEWKRKAMSQPSFMEIFPLWPILEEIKKLYHLKCHVKDYYPMCLPPIF